MVDVQHLLTLVTKIRESWKLRNLRWGYGYHPATDLTLCGGE